MLPGTKPHAILWCLMWPLWCNSQCRHGGLPHRGITAVPLSPYSPLCLD